MVILNSKQRKLLEKAAHDLQPVVIVGGAGLTEGIISMAAATLASHELIKIKFNEYKEDKQAFTQQICDNTEATLVRIIGNVAILYKPAPKADERKFEAGLAKLA